MKSVKQEILFLVKTTNEIKFEGRKLYLITLCLLCDHEPFSTKVLNVLKQCRRNVRRSKIKVIGHQLGEDTLCVICMILIHFELIVVYGVRKRSKSILLHVDILFFFLSQHYLLFFPHWIVLTHLLTVNVGDLFSFLFHWFICLSLF